MDAQTELKRIAHELRAYNPAADEYKGKHIHGVWAREIDAVLAALSDAAQAPVAWANVREDGVIVGLSQHQEDIANWQNPQPLFYGAPVASAAAEPSED